MIYFQKFVQMGDKIIHRIQNRDLLLKKVDKCNENYKKELKFLENILKEYEKDYDILKHDLFLISNSMNNFKIKKDKKIEEHFDYIIDLGKEITQKCQEEVWKTISMNIWDIEKFFEDFGREKS